MNKLLLSMMLALGICGQGFAEEGSVKDRSDLLAEEILEVGSDELSGRLLLIMSCDRTDHEWDYGGYPLSVLGMVERALTSGAGGEVTKDMENLILLTAAKVQKRRDWFEGGHPSSVRWFTVGVSEHLAYINGRAIEESEDKDSYVREVCTDKLKENYESFEKKIHENIKL